MSTVMPGSGSRAFGKRTGAVAGRTPPPRSRAPTVARDGDAQLETLKQTAEAVGAATKQAASWWWAYIQACAAAFAAVVTLSVLLLESRSPIADFSLFTTVIGIIVAPTLSTMLLIPTLVLTRIVRLLRISRGYADLTVGGLLGSIWLIARLAEGKPVEPLALCFVVGGLVGGFVFWRAQGYPGAGAAQARMMDEAYARLR